MKKDSNPKFDNAFSVNVKRLRKENGLSQQQVADLLNLERSSIAKYESGQSSPNPETLLTMAKIYNVSVDYLVRGKVNTEYSFDVSSAPSRYSNNSTLPLLNTRCMDDLTEDEQFLVLYFRMLDHDPEILNMIRDKYKNLADSEDS